jgi:hypothetical protein
MARVSAKELERQEFIEKLRAILKPGMTLHTTIRHKSASGMSRAIDVYLLKNQGKDWLSYWVAKATTYQFSEKYEAVMLGGCGMDMGFHLVNTLSRVLFPEGFGIVGELNGKKVKPRSKAHAAKLVEQGAKFRGRNGDPSGWDNDGGYALNQEWL